MSDFDEYVPLVGRLGTGGINRSENDLSSNLKNALSSFGLHGVIDTGSGSNRSKRPDIALYVERDASSGRHAKAWLMSAIRSSGCSIPIDMRTNDGVIPISRRACSVSPECTVVVGWQIKDSVPPRLTANLNT